MIISSLSRCWQSSLVFGGLGLILSLAEAQPPLTPTSYSSTLTTPDPPEFSSQTPVSTTTPSINPTTSTSTSTTPTSIFTSNWTISEVTLGSVANVSYEIIGDAIPANLLLILGKSTSPLQIPPSSELFIVQQLTACLPDNPTCTNSYTSGENVTRAYIFNQVVLHEDSSNLLNYFFCFGFAPNDNATNVVCESNSQYFNINPSSDHQDRNIKRAGVGGNILVTTPTPTPTITSITQTAYLIEATLSSISTSSSPITTTTQAPSTTEASTTASAISTSTAVTTTAKSSSHGLSVGAKVGIALGCLVVAFLLLLLALFFLRRKHARRNLPPSHHTDSFPHTALITEKDDTSPSSVTPFPAPSSNDQPFINRHSATHIPYTSLANPSSAPPPQQPPYNTGVPKRKPTANTVVSSISRGLSTISRSSGPSGSAGTNSSANFESYREVGPAPTYGDARQSPQVFTSAALREEGMTAEEVARLEEEERRIDAAIAEAEGRG